MAHMDTVRAVNAAFKSSPLSHGLVGLFVGGTSGIGEHTLKAFAASTTSPKIYLVGRNADAASRITQETLALNPSATVTFLPVTDLGTLASVDPIVQHITTHEQKLDVLVMSPGYLTMRGREPTSEGLDRKMVVNYYGRMKFIVDLLPLLRRSASTGFVPQVVSVFGTGRENVAALRGFIKAGNLDLDKPGTYSPLTCESVTVASTSLAFEHLSLTSAPDVKFRHVQPGMVADTGMARELPLWAKGGIHLFAPVIGLFVGSEKGVNVGAGIASLMFQGQGKEGGEKGGVFLGSWKGKPTDWRDAKDGNAGSKDQAKWDAERAGLRTTIWEFLQGILERSGKTYTPPAAAAAAK
ncbi:hypothetical protein DFH27DRAFT_482806 [Peziza echinospora]|nr:hypothetical protein DFH27DRAFT_482806 [Peziza echinospora]